ncbi:Pentatricopeptide repeat-containing protein [Nymphaea thermarum]|nr:Pentatricopeptide repeat-containing protein [Nymphaea thermarum]
MVIAVGCLSSLSVPSIRSQWVEKNEKGFRSEVQSIARLLQKSASSLSIDSGRQIHGRVFRLGLFDDSFLSSQLLHMYACCGEMRDAEFIFGSEPQPNLFFWNVMVRGYCDGGRHGDVVQLCEEMLVVGQTPNNFTYPFVLKACAALGCVGFGRGIHGLVLKSGFASDVFVSSSLLDMYGKFGRLGDARKLFDRMPVRNIVTWNSMVAGYGQDGDWNEALCLIMRMEDDGEVPSVTTWNSLIAGSVRNGNGVMAFEFLRLMQRTSMRPSLATINTLGPVIMSSSMVVHGKEIHAFVIRMGMGSDHTICSVLVAMYAENKHMEYASRIFEKSHVRGPELWDKMIAGYVDTGQRLDAFGIFRRMLQEGKKPNKISITLLLPYCSHRAGREIHAYAYRFGLEMDVSINNALIATYSKRGDFDMSNRVFAQMHEKDVVSWNTMVSSSVRGRDFDQALKLFHCMHSEQIWPDEYTSSSVLHICGQFAALQQGAAIHGSIVRRGFCEDHIVGNALIDMYAKCGCLDDARRLFDEMPVKDHVTWNTLISCYGVSSQPESAILLFEQMLNDGWKPNRVTFVAVLSACSRAGFVERSLFYFNTMTSVYGIRPDREHYGCMVDALGRAGWLDQAFQLVKSMPMEPDDCIWGALLGACRIHRNLELAEVAAKHLVELCPENSGYHVLLSNTYAEAGRWHDAAQIRSSMKENQVKKFPGCSWIELGETVHTFFTSDKSHKQSEEIYTALEQLTGQLKAVSCMPIMIPEIQEVAFLT